MAQRGKDIQRKNAQISLIVIMPCITVILIVSFEYPICILQRTGSRNVSPVDWFVIFMQRQLAQKFIFKLLVRMVMMCNSV